MLYEGAEFEIGNHWVLVDIIGYDGDDVDYRIVDVEVLESTQFFDLDYDQLHYEITDFAYGVAHRWD
jgi:hypothetical protein